MSDVACIFCKIIAKSIPSSIIHENNDILVIEDIAPKAPIHYLILPKKHIQTMASIEEQDLHLISKMAQVVKVLGNTKAPGGTFNIVSNNGEAAGQSVGHLHWHFLAGKNIYSGGFSL